LRRLEDLVDAAERAEALLEACARAARASPQQISRLNPVIPVGYYRIMWVHLIRVCKSII